MLSPASAVSNNFLNISTPVTVVVLVSLIPTISTGSPTLTTPRSTRPVATVPRPVIVNTSSTGIMNGLSVARGGVSMYASTAAINSSTLATYSGLPSNAPNAEPLITGMSSPGKSYSDNNSLTSISTKSNNSSSSTKSALFKKTTNLGTPTWRDNKICSRVCGIGPSAADTTKIAPSICAAPVIMFLT